MSKPRLRALAVVLLSISTGMFAPAPEASGGSAPVANNLRVFALGRSRPAGAWNVQQAPRHYPNPDLLKLLKQAMAAASASAPSKPGGALTANPAPQTFPTSNLGVGGANGQQSFVGLGFLDSFAVPPDTIVTAGTDGAVNPQTYVFEAVNLVGQFYSPTGAASASIDLSACTPNPGLDSVSDPRVLYDSGRWFISLITFDPISDAGWDLIISTGSDPAKTQWLCVTIPTGAIKNPDGSIGNFPDFPKMGINSDKVVITGDAYSAVRRRFSTTYKFQGTEFVVLNKADLLNAGPGSGIRAAVLNPPQGDVAIEPAQHLPVSPAPAGPVGTLPSSSLYMASVNSGVSSTSTLHVWTVSGLPGNSLTVKVNALGIHTLALPPNAQQSGTSMLIDTNDDSLLDAVYRSTSGQLWVSANDGCTPAGDNAVRACSRYTDVSISSSSMSVAQDFDLAKARNYYYFPAIRTNRNGDLVTAFTTSSSATIPSVYAARRLGTDTPNQLTSWALVHQGDTPYTLSPPRWGDYSGVGVDPNDSTMWTAGEYAANCLLFGTCWGTWVASVP